MLAYIGQRLLLIVPTLFGILLLNFIVVQFAPGGPVERFLAELETEAVDATAGIGGAGLAADTASPMPGARGIDPAFRAEIETLFGFDKPPLERFGLMLMRYAHFDLGESFFRGVPVAELIWQRLPVSLSLAAWTLVLVHLFAIPLGMAKAVRDGTAFDAWTSLVVVIAYATPSFLLAIFLIVLFAGGSFLDLFPLRGLVAHNWRELAWYQVIASYLWHMALPVTALVIGGLAGLTLLTKNSFLEELNKPYVLTARAKGLTQRAVLYGHVFRNAMLIVIAGFPTAFMTLLFSGALLIEVIFSLDGLGLLGFKAVINRDYPVVFGTLFVFTLIGLVFKLISDLLYVAVDPRIDFAARPG